jgi:hypothetical protein
MTHERVHFLKEHECELVSFLSERSEHCKVMTMCLMLISFYYEVSKLKVIKHLWEDPNFL